MGVLAPVALAGLFGLAAVINPGPELTGSVDRVLADPAITESSGLALSARFPGVLYTHNDSDGDPVVYAVDPTGETRARLSLADAPARDWEAMAAGTEAGVPVLWVADIGDNISGWDSVRLLKISEPDELTDKSVQWDRFDLVYPDGSHNAETLLLHPDGRMWIVTKEASAPGIYAVPPLRADGPNQLTRVAEAPAGITDGAIDADGRVVLVDYVYAYTADSIEGPWVRSPLPFRPQGESVTWDGSDLLVGSEGVNSEVLRVSTEPLGGAAADAPTPATSESSGAAAAPPQEAARTGGGLPGWAPWAVGAAVGTLVAVVLIRQRRDEDSAPQSAAD